jgi:hypothetical protein
MKLTGEGASIGRALSDYVQGKDKVLVLVENSFQKLDITGKNATTTGMLTTGNIDLNANGVAILNVKSIASANGTWSIDENGRIVAKVLCLEDLCIDKNTLTNILNISGQQGIIMGTTTSTSTDQGTGGSSNGGDTGTTTDATGDTSTTTDQGTGGNSGSNNEATPPTDETPPSDTTPESETPPTPVDDQQPPTTPETTPPEGGTGETPAP